MLAEVIGYMAGVITSVCYFPQLYKMIKTRKAEDISFYTFSLLLCGLVLWLIYGIMIANWPVTITNAFSATIVLLIIVLKRAFEK